MKQETSLTVAGLAPSSGGMDRPISVTPDDEKEFHLALELYKDQSGRLFPTCSELLEVLRSLGYEKRIWKPVDDWALNSGHSPDSSEPQQRSQAVLGWCTNLITPAMR